MTRSYTRESYQSCAGPLHVGREGPGAYGLVSAVEVDLDFDVVVCGSRHVVSTWRLVAEGARLALPDRRTHQIIHFIQKLISTCKS